MELALKPEHERLLSSIRGTRALITGGAGFIGSHITRALLERGVRVRVIDDLSTGHQRNVPDGAEFIRGSILERREIEAAAAGCDVVFHQAAVVSVPLSVEDPGRCVEVNVTGTLRVLEAARRGGVRRVLLASSAACYGDRPSLPSRETDAPVSCSPYAMSKVAGEQMLSAYAKCYGLQCVSLRYFNIFGPGQDAASPYAAVIARFSAMIGSGQTMRMTGDGLQTRDFTYIDNAVFANLLAAASERSLAGEVFNVGTQVRTSLRELAEEMGRIIGRKAVWEPGPARAGDVRDSLAEISKAKDWLGYEPIVQLREGLRRTLTA